MLDKNKEYCLRDRHYDSTNGYISFICGPATEPNDKNEIKIVADLYGCRDGLGGALRKIITGKERNDRLKTDKTRFVFQWSSNNRSGNCEKTNAEHRAWAERGLNILHAAEKVAGWPLTKAVWIKPGAEYITALYCLSSRRWLKAPYLITLYVLFMRIAADTRLTGFKNLEELQKIITKLDSVLKRDAAHVTTTMPYWKVILLGYPDLFRQFKMPYYWSMDRIPSNTNEGYGEGISRLCDGSTKATATRNKLMEIKNQLEKE